LNYFAHWSPAVGQMLWGQTIAVLDGLNAAVFAMACRDQALALAGHSLAGLVSRRAEWRAGRMDASKASRWSASGRGARKRCRSQRESAWRNSRQRAA